MSELSENQSLRDYLDWKTSLFLPLPEALLENLKETTELSQSLMQTIVFVKNPAVFSEEKRQILLALLATFFEALKRKSGGENDITCLSALAGEIMNLFQEMEDFRKQGKLILEEKYVAPFYQSFRAWNGILSQFRWVERTISAYISQFDLTEEHKLPAKEEIKANMRQLLNHLPPDEDYFK